MPGDRHENVCKLLGFALLWVMVYCKGEMMGRKGESRDRREGQRRDDGKGGREG